jgi:hypothetical protein
LGLAGFVEVHQQAFALFQAAFLFLERLRHLHDRVGVPLQGGVTGTTHPPTPGSSLGT